MGFLAAHPRMHLHFTPTSAWWLNAVDLESASMRLVKVASPS
jgi:hypothetical protein